MDRYKDFLGLGIAGNFALHLEQAGESADFKDIKTEDPNGPKGMFPFYIPGKEGQLGIYPIGSDTIFLPKEAVNVQPEPEVGLICDILYDGQGNIADIIPRFLAPIMIVRFVKRVQQKSVTKKTGVKIAKVFQKH